MTPVNLVLWFSFKVAKVWVDSQDPTASVPLLESFDGIEHLSPVLR